MDIDTDRIDAAVLALLLLGLHDGSRVWKTFDWDAMNRLHDKGMISDPVGKAKSVVLTEEGQREAERLFQEMYAARR
jgi:DNA-binding PadR family transcriptional regulator